MDNGGTEIGHGGIDDWTGKDEALDRCLYRLTNRPTSYGAHGLLTILQLTNNSQVGCHGVCAESHRVTVVPTQRKSDQKTLKCTPNAVHIYHEVRNI